MTTRELTIHSPARLNILRCSMTGAGTLAILFAACWAGAVLAPSQSHMAISLFTTEPVASTAALLIGLVWSLVFGASSGALVAVLYNAFGFMDR